jgi:alpha-tubulin suppressor-like RCC1 family protein
VTESGELFTFGFNVMGQLGLGDAKTRYYPQRVSRDILGNAVPRFVDVQCGYNTTFAIDESGLLWSWGGGNIAHKNDKK